MKIMPNVADFAAPVQVARQDDFTTLGVLTRSKARNKKDIIIFKIRF
jgi:hypothetical protein